MAASAMQQQRGQSKKGDSAQLAAAWNFPPECPRMTPHGDTGPSWPGQLIEGPLEQSEPSISPSKPCPHERPAPGQAAHHAGRAQRWNKGTGLRFR